HVTVDKNDKTLYLTGKGKAYAKAWGGPKDLVYEDMSDFAGEAFHVNLTEKVGNNTWYRGDFKGKTIWLHESYVTELKVDKTSKLGHLSKGATIYETSKLGHLSKGATIYETIGDSSTSLSSDDYLNAV